MTTLTIEKGKEVRKLKKDDKEEEQLLKLGRLSERGVLLQAEVEKYIAPIRTEALIKFLDKFSQSWDSIRTKEICLRELNDNRKDKRVAKELFRTLLRDVSPKIQQLAIECLMQRHQEEFLKIKETYIRGNL